MKPNPNDGDILLPIATRVNKNKILIDFCVGKAGDLHKWIEYMMILIIIYFKKCIKDLNQDTSFLNRTSGF